MKVLLLLLLIFAITPSALASIHIEAEDCTISSWDILPSGAAVQVAVPPTTTVNAVEIVGAKSDATGVGKLQLPVAIPDGEYTVKLRYFTNRTYSDSEIAVQFGSASGTVIARQVSASWHTFYPNSAAAAWYTWFDLELTPSGCPFPISSTEPMPTSVGIYNVTAGDFYITIWDKSDSSFDLATIDYIELVEVPDKTSDLTNDGYVNFDDLKIIMDNYLLDAWIADLYPVGSGDGTVDGRDFAFFAKDWLKAALHVADIAPQSLTTGCSAGSWSAKFTVTVQDKRGDPISGVEVTADWGGVHISEGTAIETTDANGQAVFISKCLPIAGDTTLIVTNLQKAGHAYYENENVETSDIVSYSVPWTSVTRAEDWLVTPVFGNYAKVDGPGGKVILSSTDAGGNPTHAVGDLKFSFPGIVPDDNYTISVNWYSGTMSGTPWAYKLGREAGSITENGVIISNDEKWHYFYPGHAAPDSDQWFSHDYSGPTPIDFSMWPNSAVSTSVTIAPASSDSVTPDANEDPIYVSFDTRVNPSAYPTQPMGFQATPMTIYGGWSCPEGGPGAEHWKMYTAWNYNASPGWQFYHFTGEGTVTFDNSLPAGDYIVNAYWCAGAWSNGSYVALKFSGSGVTEHGTDDPGGWHYIYPTTTTGEPVTECEIIGPSMGPGSTALTTGPNPSYYPTGEGDFGTYITLEPGNQVTFTVNEQCNNNYGRVFFYGLTFIPAIVTDPGSVEQGNFYIRLRDISPAEDNYFGIESFEITPIP